MRALHRAYIVDDDPIFQMGIREHARHADFCHDLHFFENGKLALDTLKRILLSNIDEAPDIILVDLNMPVMDGWEFLEALQQLDLKKQMIVHIISSSIDPDDLRRAREFDIVQRFISKPLRREDLMKIKTDAQNI